MKYFTKFRPNFTCLFAALAVAYAPAYAQRAESEPVIVLDPVVVTATRTEQKSFDVPGSIDAIDSRTIQEGQAKVNLSEPLARVPGIVVQNRQNYAQDLQISSRGFGGRSTFGVRGIRLIADDIPATMPDGQGQAATFNLDSAKRIEVLRGPFSALYGNSSGGVVQVFTEDGPARPTLSVDGMMGSYDTSKFGVKFGGTAGDFNYIFSGSRFDTDGYRDHSAATRDHVNGKFRINFSERSRLSLIINSLRQPDTQDPLGLERKDFDANPTQATLAKQYNTRKSIKNDQVGLVFEQKLRDNDVLKIVGYTGTREIVQFLAIPSGPQNAATHSGGVVDLDREFNGLDARYTLKAVAGSHLFTFTGGIEYAKMEERRKGFKNHIGTQLGVVGDLKRDEDNSVSNFDQYLQGEWLPNDDWRVLAGIRHSEVKFSSTDYFIATGNGNDSGSKSYQNTSPVLGVMYSISPTVNIYGNYGQGFETPTFVEVAYVPSPATGLNFNLKPSKSQNFELGMKAKIADAARVNVALFQIDTRDEIVPATNSGGRATFQNASKTERNGVEIGVETSFGKGFTGLVSYSYLNAIFKETFSYTSQGTPRTVLAGNRIPGVPKDTLYAEIGWRGNGVSTAVEARYSGNVYVDDRNSDNAKSYTVVNVRIGFEQKFGGLKLKEFARLDNVFDENYAGSVIVNEANSRFFEAAPERNYTIGISASYAF